MCDLFVEVGPDAPTLLDGWTARDLAAHLVLRERDLLAGPCLVLPGPFQRFAERRRSGLAERREFGWLVGRLRFAQSQRGGERDGADQYCGREPDHGEAGRVTERAETANQRVGGGREAAAHIRRIRRGRGG